MVWALWRHWLCVLCLSIGVAHASQAEVWIVGSQDGVPPFNYLAADGSYTGIDVDILNEAAATIGVILDHRPMPWRRALLDFEAGQLDAVFQLTPTPERFENWVMIGPLRSTRTVFITRADSRIKDISGLEDLDGLTLGVVAGYTYGHALDDDTSIAREVSADDFANVRKLLLGRSDVIVGGQATLLSVLSALNASDRVRILPTPLVERDRFVAFQRTEDGLARGARLQTALDDMRASGRIGEIISFHLSR